MARAKALFSDVDLFAVSIRPEPPKTGHAVAVETQTTPIKARDVGTSVAVATEAGSQTEAPGSIGVSTGSGSGEAKDGEAKDQADDDSVAVRRLAPRMLAELSRSAGSTALHGYPPPPPAGSSAARNGLSSYSSSSSSSGSSASSPHCSLKPRAASLAARQHLQCTGVGWNAGGTVVCACFGNLATAGWCLQGGSLCAWPVFRRGFDPAAAPDVVLEHSSCLMALACHPAQPSLVACGSFNGEVLLFDLSRAARHAPGRAGSSSSSSSGGGSGSEGSSGEAESSAGDPLVFASKVLTGETSRWVLLLLALNKVVPGALTPCPSPRPHSPPLVICSNMRRLFSRRWTTTSTGSRCGA
jgi:hypothetical protein